MTHGDFHDGNIGFDASRRPVVIDFGLSNRHEYTKGFDAETLVAVLAAKRYPHTIRFASKLQNLLGPFKQEGYSSPTTHILEGSVDNFMHMKVSYMNALRRRLDKVSIPGRVKTWDQMFDEYR